MREAGRGRVGGWVSTQGRAGLRAASVALGSLLVLVYMCLPFCSVTVNAVREQKSLGGPKFVRLSFGTTAEL